MKYKTIIGILLLVILVVFGFVNKIQTSNVQILALLPLTGGSSEQGEWVKNGIQLALNELEKDRGSKIDVIFEDTQGDPKNAIAAYTKIKSLNEIPAVITWGSGVGMALTPVVNNDKVLQVGVATAIDAYSTPDDYTFRIFPSAHQEAEYMSKQVYEKMGYRNVVILNINNDYGNSVAKAFKESFEKMGGSVVMNQAYDATNKDFRTILSKINNYKADMIYLSSYPGDGALMLKQARDLGIKLPVVASSAVLGGSSFFEIAGDAAEGLVFSSSVAPLNSMSSPELQKFVQAYTDTYKVKVGPQQLYAARGYDAVKILAKAFKKCDTDTACVKDYLFSVQNYDGASGKVSFDKNGDITSDFNLQVFRKGVAENFN